MLSEVIRVSFNVRVSSFVRVEIKENKKIKYAQ